MHELIRTKVAPPIWMGNQIGRDDLLARLDDALGRRLTLIHAPAGYGKTSLLSQWRHRIEGQSVLVAWLTLEHDDSDPMRLAQYVALALSGSGRDDESGPDGEPMSGDLPPRAALSALVNRIAQEHRQVVLILDDLHRADSPPVVEFLKGLIRLAPPNCHFVIASRDYPWLGQSVLAAEEQLLEFTADDLKFSTLEAEALLARANAPLLAAADMQSIVERTEGWAIALQLTSLSLKRGIDQKLLVEQFHGPSSEVARYLSEQVLMTLPEETQEIVIRTALIDRLTGDVVNLLCDRTDGWLMLERLEQQGVFLTPLSAERQAYRYHQLFAEYLRERLARRDSAQYSALQTRAAQWFSERGEVAQAVHHAIQSDDNELLATILETAGGWRLILQGHQAMVERGLAKIPETIINARPRLILARVYLDIKRGEMGMARSAYDAFIAAVSDGDVPTDLQTEIRVVGDVLDDYENVPITLDDLLAREALLRTLPSNDHLILANFTETLGAKYFEGGWLERALEPTLAARAHYQALGLVYSDIFTRFLEARVKRAQGRLKDAADILARSRIQIEANFGAYSDLAANCAAFEADVLYEQDRTGEAMAMLEWALPHMEQSDGWVDVYATAYSTAARVSAAEGAMDEALEMLARARRVARRRRLRQLELLADFCELELLLHHGHDVEPAQAYADNIGMDAFADQMTEDSPLYRPVAAAASMCRVKLALRLGDSASALKELRELQRWATQHGAGRMLIDIHILTSYTMRLSGDVAQAQSRFNEAVSMAMFQGILRPFVDAYRFVQPCLDDTMNASAQIDRFRAQFLKTMARALSNRPSSDEVHGFLNDAEAAVLGHLSQGYSNKEIARLIGMSPDTVKYRLKSIFRKVGVNKRRDVVRVSQERGLILPAEISVGTPPAA